MKRVPWAAAGIALLLAALVLPAAQPDRKAAEASRRETLDKIARAERQLQNTAAEKNRNLRELRDTERSVSRISGDLSALGSERARRLESRRRLVAERSKLEADKQATESDLARQLRAAYFMGRSEPLKLLLNQRNPAEFGRNLTYYGYLGRLRASQINLISNNIVKIDELTAQIDAEDAELANLESRKKDRLGEMEAERRKRSQARASLEQESRNQTVSLKRLQTELQQWEQLLKRLNQAAQTSPYDPDSPFSRAKGKLSWPVAGRVALNFGGAGPGGSRSQGIQIDADRGATVRAVAEGEVLFSDWTKARGNLIILDHGNGYLSIYCHNDELFKPAGSRVQAGDKIATVGDSGGRPKAGLYFEIRRNNEPVNPRDWFSTSAPPTG